MKQTDTMMNSFKMVTILDLRARFHSLDTHQVLSFYMIFQSGKKRKGKMIDPHSNISLRKKQRNTFGTLTEKITRCQKKIKHFNSNFHQNTFSSQEVHLDSLFQFIMMKISFSKSCLLVNLFTISFTHRMQLPIELNLSSNIKIMTVYQQKFNHLY